MVLIKTTIVTLFNLIFVSGSANRPDGLKYADLNILSNSACRNNYNFDSDQIRESNLCTYTQGKDACQGDSGGKLHIKAY